MASHTGHKFMCLQQEQEHCQTCGLTEVCICVAPHIFRCISDVLHCACVYIYSFHLYSSSLKKSFLH